MKPVVEIFSQGEELVNGQIVDSNAAWLSQKLLQMGFVVKRHTAVGDNLADLKTLLIEISARADCCICTGGLGPTVDDLTAQAVAEAFVKPLQFDPVALTQIQRYFQCRNREMVDANRKQAWFPADSVRIDNEWGTAPGFSLQHNRCWFAFVPGVPSEMKHLFDDYISKALVQRFSLQPDKLITLRSVGIGESDIQQKLETVDLPKDVQLGFRTSSDEIQTKLLFSGDADQHKINACVDRVADCIGDYVYAVDEVNSQALSLVQVISELMQQQQFTLSVLETASHGLIAAKCVGQPWFLRSTFEQSLENLANSFKVNWQPTNMPQMCVDIAEIIQLRDQCDLVLVQIYSGSSEQFYNKEQTITVYNALLTPAGWQSSQHTVGGPQKRKQNQSAIRALDLLRRYLQHHAFNTLK